MPRLCHVAAACTDPEVRACNLSRSMGQDLSGVCALGEYDMTNDPTGLLSLMFDIVEGGLILAVIFYVVTAVACFMGLLKQHLGEGE